MKDFRDKRWSPEGPRPHAYLIPGETLHQVCDQALAPGGLLDRWYRQWRDILTPIDPGVRHITLAWVDCPTVATPPGSWDAAAGALTEAVSEFGPITVTLDRVETSSSAVEARFAPTPELLHLGEVVRETLQQVDGPDIRVHPGVTGPTHRAPVIRPGAPMGRAHQRPLR